MKIKQLSVFIENKEGRLKKTINTLVKADINIRALSIADTSKFGILRLIVSDFKKAKNILEEDGFVVKETDVIAVEIPDETNGLGSVLTILDKEEVNLEYLYAFVSKQSHQAIVVFRVQNIEKSIKLLKNENLKLLNQKDLEEF
ncbi:amino acid-binding protein [Methanobrevibacter curvatus]|uniref:ACT domain-containing protein n=1 Tax=Methanobrevibacter curvatus TaxID=49547 RepID=A0A166CAA7_9EURY|nr:amino acid-binding protein [Methanobrevibacter curvatus]KZX14294.1 hypothetical protein MBCUR_05180 [Methanobrevibacter curvatus]